MYWRMRIVARVSAYRPMPNMYYFKIIINV